MDVSINIRDRRSLTLTNTSTATDSKSSDELYQDQNEKQVLLHALSLPTRTLGDDSKQRLQPRSRFKLTGLILLSLCGIAALWRAVFASTLASTTFRVSAGEAFHYTDNSTPEEVPSILSISDSRDHSRWTVHIPHNYSFPLRASHAQAVCKHAEAWRETSGRQSRLTSASFRLRKPTYYSPDESFLEIEKAARLGVLSVDDYEEKTAVCEQSLTFVLDEDDDSFGKSLLLLWMSYGLAQREKRAFFIDDTRWPYGRYTSYFPPPPIPDCASPPPQRIVPCPHSAKHLMVSSATIHWTFGSSFEDQFLQLRKGGNERSHRIFDLLRRGYDDLFRLSGELALYAMSRIAKFKEEATEGSIIGIHIRRGNLHPYEAQFSQDYIPVERYGEVARSLVQSLQQHRDTGNNEVQTVEGIVNSPLLLATDDPEMFNSYELQQSVLPFTIQRAQERVELATKSRLDVISPAVPIREPDTPFKHVDENSGLEGGFFPCSEAVQQMRQSIARAYVLDLAVVSSSDGIVCGIASSTCRILAVMLGWTKLEEGRWHNVDDGRAWSWNGA